MFLYVLLVGLEKKTLKLTDIYISACNCLKTLFAPELQNTVNICKYQPFGLYPKTIVNRSGYQKIIPA